MRSRALTVLMVSLLGLPAALVWVWWAEPAVWLATANGLVMPESGATGQFDVVATFIVIGAVVGLIAGTATVYAGRPLRWPAVLVAALSATGAAVVCWIVGSLFGPPAPGSVTGVSPGDTVPAQFLIDTPVAFLVWPTVSVFVVVFWSYLSVDPIEDDQEPDEDQFFPKRESEPFGPQ